MGGRNASMVLVFIILSFRVFNFAILPATSGASGGHLILNRLLTPSLPQVVFPARLRPKADIRRGQAGLRPWRRAAGPDTVGRWTPPRPSNPPSAENNRRWLPWVRRTARRPRRARSCRKRFCLLVPAGCRRRRCLLPSIP